MTATSWFAPTTVLIRDEGASASVDAEGKPTAARGPWPEGCGVYIPDTLDTGTWEQIQQLQLRGHRLHSTEVGTAVDGELRILTPALTYAAACIVGFEGPVFEDPATGKTAAMPDDIEDRLAVVKKLPLQVTSLVYAEVTKRIGAPLRTEDTPVEDADAPEQLHPRKPRARKG